MRLVRDALYSAAALVLWLGIDAQVLGQNVNAELAAGASVVFVGTVQETQGSTFAAMPQQPGMMVVRVDEVIKKPRSIDLARDDRLTVIVEDGAPMAAQERGIFYTDIALIGETLGVRQLAREALGVPAAAAAEIGVMFDIADPAVAQIVSEAQVIAVGRVVAVRELAVAEVQGDQPQRQPVTEHDPKWKEAVIEVSRGIQGTNAGEVLVVRFPASIDVAWYRSPKFEVGAEGTFMLNADVMSGRAETAEVSGVSRPTFTALEPQSVAPISAADAINTLVEP